jgi:ubiquitin C-terminal hydrolase
MSRHKWDGKSSAPLVADGYSAPTLPPPSLIQRSLDAIPHCPLLLKQYPNTTLAAIILAGGFSTYLFIQWLLEDDKSRSRRSRKVGRMNKKKNTQKAGMTPHIKTRPNIQVTQQRNDIAPDSITLNGAASGPSAAASSSSLSGSVSYTSPNNRSSASSSGSEVESETSPVTPKGFRNVGNSCYLNSLLQALSSSGPFLTYLRDLSSLAHRSNGDSAIHISYFMDSLLRLVSQEDTSSSSTADSLNPMQFLGLLKEEARGKFAHFNQEDAHELWNVLQDILERKAKILHQQWMENMEERNYQRGIQQKFSSATPLRDAPSDGFDSMLTYLKMKSITPASNAPAAAAAAAAAAAGAAAVAGKSTAAQAVSSSFSPLIDASIADTDLDSPHSDRATSPDGLHSSTDQLSRSANRSLPIHSNSNGFNATSLSLPDVFASLPSDPFLGLACDFLQCTRCHCSSRPGVRLTPFNSLTLNFSHSRGNDGGGGEDSLEQMLDTFIAAESLSDVRCESCNWAERSKLLKAEYARVISNTKSGTKRSRYIAFLHELMQETDRRVMMTQPNAGQLLAAGSSNSSIGLNSRFGNPNKNGTSVRPQSTSATMSRPLPAATSNGVSSHSMVSSSSADAFLSTSPSADSLLSSLPVQMDAWERLKNMLPNSKSDDMISPAIASLPNKAESFLRSVFNLDTRRSFHKRTLLSRLPHALCIHLARLQAHRKITRDISFPLLLSMAKYTALWSAETQITAMNLSLDGKYNQSNYANMQQEWTQLRSGQFHKHNSNSEADADEFRISQRKYQIGLQLYELDSVVVHMGNAHGGHYICYRRQSMPIGQSNIWWRMSDEDRRQVSVEEVLASQAYLLIYQAQNQSLPTSSNSN